MAVEHYENFPVASILLPSRLRQPVEVIYHFARSADDIADEGDLSSSERLAALSFYADELDRIGRGETPRRELFVALGKTVRDFHLPLEPFKNLLFAFRQDISVKRYDAFADLLDYCRCSANPVGLLMLHLYDAATEENCRMSDAICTALQLINFWQDVALDWQKDRIYIPQEDMRAFGVTPDDIAGANVSENWKALMAFETERTRKLMHSGAPLAEKLPGRIGWELRLVVQGGLRILERIESAGFDVFRKRPVLRGGDWLSIVWRCLKRRSR
ncbi:squalene synthase HpnC [Oxalobacter paraformigenes]|uniref:Squalene synthase HpnC n=1 Tax=Oxalobacter paraformigenes TaxID=556268 RepID=C3X2Y3_9BURK|nr:squalene synthase HpnC [Oxalobacter paraformigenes]EEO27569.2 squalene synthase HpnC [Oxalobacter paraformigenes]